MVVLLLFCLHLSWDLFPFGIFSTASFVLSFFTNVAEYLPVWYLKVLSWCSHAVFLRLSVAFSGRHCCICAVISMPSTSRMCLILFSFFRNLSLSLSAFLFVFLCSKSYDGSVPSQLTSHCLDNIQLGFLACHLLHPITIHLCALWLIQ